MFSGLNTHALGEGNAFTSALLLRYGQALKLGDGRDVSCLQPLNGLLRFIPFRVLQSFCGEQVPVC